VLTSFILRRESGSGLRFGKTPGTQKARLASALVDVPRNLISEALASHRARKLFPVGILFFFTTVSNAIFSAVETRFDQLALNPALAQIGFDTQRTLTARAPTAHKSLGETLIALQALSRKLSEYGFNIITAEFAAL
jgi:hypothetical protein